MIYEIFEEMGWEWSLCMTYTYEIKEKNLFRKCKESRNFLPHFWVRGPVSEGAVVGSPTLASLPDWDPNLCLSLTNLVSHHANAVPRQWLLSKSTFSRLLTVCQRITKRSLTRAGRRKSSGGARVGDWETVWSEIRIRCFLTHMDGQIPGRDFLTEQYMFVCWISTVTVLIQQVTKAPQWKGGSLGVGELAW